MKVIDAPWGDWQGRAIDRHALDVANEKPSINSVPASEPQEALDIPRQARVGLFAKLRAMRRRNKEISVR